MRGYFDSRLVCVPMTMPMKGEQKLWLVTLFDGLCASDRDEWVGSEDFVEVCQTAGVDPQLAASMPRSKAKQVRRILTNTCLTFEQILEELREVRRAN